LGNTHDAAIATSTIPAITPSDAAVDMSRMPVKSILAATKQSTAASPGRR
jgi:hypothetical protein